VTGSGWWRQLYVVVLRVCGGNGADAVQPGTCDAVATLAAVNSFVISGTDGLTMTRQPVAER
jgi:hypothetical protein